VSVIAYRHLDQRTRDLMDDLWASTELSPTVIDGLVGELIEVSDHVGQGVYLLDNGIGFLPDGTALRAQYVTPNGKVTEIFRVNGLPGDTATWQAKAVEPLIHTINRRQRRMERAGHGPLAVSD
jgi:hypothetical protein